MAAGPLACYLYDHLKIKKDKLTIEQGRLITPPSPSKLLVELTIKNGQITRLIAGEQAQVMKTIEVTLS